MKIYVASSWRNARQPLVVDALRKAGHDVYDFKNPAPGENGFAWRQICGDDRAALTEPLRYRDEVLTHPIARAGFALDMAALRAADVAVLVLPCGRSAHLELGYARGAGKATIVLLDEKVDEPELMYLMCWRICLSIEGVLAELAEMAAWDLGAYVESLPIVPGNTAAVATRRGTVRP